MAMKKNVAIVISLVLFCFSLFGCEEKKTPPPPKAAKELPEALKGGDPKKINTDFIREAEKKYFEEQNKK